VRSIPSGKKIWNVVFGQRVRAFRISLGLTGNELAERIGLGGSGLRAVENGWAGVSAKTLSRLRMLGFKG